jgi:hypothetical protein
MQSGLDAAHQRIDLLSEANTLTHENLELETSNRQAQMEQVIAQPNSLIDYDGVYVDNPKYTWVVMSSSKYVCKIMKAFDNEAKAVAYSKTS